MIGDRIGVKPDPKSLLKEKKKRRENLRRR